MPFSLVWENFVLNFCNSFDNGYYSVFFPCSNIFFSWFLYQGNGLFIERVEVYSYSVNFWEEFVQKLCFFFFLINVYQNWFLLWEGFQLQFLFPHIYGPIQFLHLFQTETCVFQGFCSFVLSDLLSFPVIPHITLICIEFVVISIL